MSRDAQGISRFGKIMGHITLTSACVLTLVLGYFMLTALDAGRLENVVVLALPFLFCGYHAWGYIKGLSEGKKL